MTGGKWLVCNVCVTGILLAAGMSGKAEEQLFFSPGTWLAESDDGCRFLFFDEEENFGRTADLESGMGVPFEYEWNGAQALFRMGAEDITESCEVEVVDEQNLIFYWESGLSESLSFYSELSSEYMHFYTNTELCEMALAQYESMYGLPEGGICAVPENQAEGSVLIHLFQDSPGQEVTFAKYVIDRHTGEGMDEITGNPVKLINGSPDLAITRVEPEELAELLSYEECILDTSEYHSELLLTPEVPLADVALVSVEWVSGESGEAQGFAITEELGFWEELTPDTPLMVSMTLPEVIPNTGVCYWDRYGERVFWAIGESGMDGSPILMEDTLIDSSTPSAYLLRDARQLC